MKPIKPIFACLFCLLILNACKKDQNILSTNVQPASDPLTASFSDTSRIYAHTVKYDSIPSFNDRFKFLGSNQDPVFGRTDVGLYLNASIPNNITNVNFGEDANLVSSELILVVANLDFVGNYETALSYSVFPVSVSLDKNSAYYSSNNRLHNTNAVLGSYSGTFAVMNNKLVLRIPIDFNYAKAVLNHPQYLVNNSVFQSTYKGFYITSMGSALNPVSAQGAISKFDLDDELSGFYLYYQNGTPSATKTNKTYRFTFTGNDALRFNTVNYQPSSGGNILLTKQILENDTILAGKSNLFLKGLGGTRLKVYVPGLKNFADSFNIAVNRAELELQLDPSFNQTGGLYLSPPRLALMPIQANGKEGFALDQLNQTDLTRYDGQFSNNKYVFNIARHVQAILRGTIPNLGFYVVVADPTPLFSARRDNFAERAIIAGTAHPTLAPKFKLTFLKFRYDQ
jgi:hypothetical protein